MSKNLRRAYLGAGCFWGVEKAFKELDGVVETTVGFMGGEIEDPSYKRVCKGDTGHAEVVEVEYNPNVLSYGDLLDTFWKVHDPTQLNRQGFNVGEQYRSAIFYMDEDQKREAEASKKRMEESEKYKNKIVTEVVPVDDFYKAEEYHQDYYEKQGK